MTLVEKWQLRLTLRAEGAKLYAEGAKLYAERDKLRAEGDKGWAEAIIETHGNITLRWITKKDRLDCELETGEYFAGDALKDVAELV